MRIGVLNRYLIRAHLGPFIFAFSAITGLLFLNVIALRMEGLVGKGLPWGILGRFFVLSLPHTIALSLPMAVLVAVLYAFSELTEHNEITALSAGGIRPARVLIPLLIMGSMATGVMLYFDDAVLPEANHQLKNLLVDIGRKSPTFQLEEGRVNPIRTSNDRVRYFLTAKRIDPQANTLQNIAIYDRNDPSRERTTFARRGSMAFNANRTDLFLTLYDGQVLETQADRKGGFSRVFFRKEVVPMRGVGDELQAQMGGTQRSDREMTFAMLREHEQEQRAEARKVRNDSRRDALEAVRASLGISAAVDSAGAEDGAAAGTVRPRSAPRPNSRASSFASDPLSHQAIAGARQKLERLQTAEEQADRYRTQLHKMWAIPFACLVFTLIGPPLALRFPRGGVGMVVAASTAIFSVYYVGLIAGEALADRRAASPVLSMWISDIVFGVVGLLLAARMGRAGSTVRGGGWQDLWTAALDRLRRTPKRPHARHA